MNNAVWLPALLVLGVGLALGLAASAAVRRGRRRKPGDSGQELLLRDLEARRDDLYRQLRSPGLAPGDRESLELAAAHTLRELDRLAPGRSQAPPAAAAGEAPAAAPEKAPLPVGGRHAALVGFVAGMAVVLLVGALVYLAFRDSGAAQAPQATAADPTAAPHPDEGTLSAELQRELAQLEAAAAAAPNDLLARKRLALGRLDAGLYFEAFGDAEAILASHPDDPDGLYIQGVVRLSMGRASEAVELLDRVLARYPEHLRAMIYRGLALAQGGDMEQAIATWELALEMAGGSHPDLESLLEQAYAQPLAAQSPAPSPPPPAPAPSSPPAAQPAPQSAPATADAGSYQVTINVAAGRAVSPSTVLFVFLRTGDSGPPVAVKRVPSPRFPLQLTLGAGDAMMAGTAIPAQGILVARLSASGSASSRGPDDLEASAQASIGQAVSLVLGGS